MNLDIAGQWALVTGSSAGIGRAIAEAFLKEGARVVLTGRDRARLDQTKGALGAAFPDGDLLAFAGNLQDQTVLDALADHLDTRIGALHHLVCNIGSGRSLPPLEEDGDEFRRMLDINLMAAAAAVRALLPLLEKTAAAAQVSPSITFIGSICGLQDLPCPLGYAAAKAGLERYAKVLARLLGGRNIRVNTVSPGNVLFPGSVWERKRAEDRAAVDRMLVAEVALRRLGTPGEIADVVVFLASPRAGFVTGANWVVDGGQTH